MQTYIVQAGDTLYGISKQFGISVEDIKLSNNLSDNTIVVGQSLLIPSVGTTTLYIVKAGDTLYSIANRFNTTVNDLIRINNLKSNVLHIGQQLKIPVNDSGGSDEYVLYIVKAGDTLYSISRQYGISVSSLRKYNNLSSNLLSIGQQLKIPTTVNDDENTEDIIIYVVRAGDSLYSIAKRYGMTVDELMKLNNLTSTTLKVGQPLRLVFQENNTIPIDSSCYGEGYSEPVFVTYTVQSGDNLYSIAKRYGVTVDSIIQLNNLKNTNLSIGQVLKIKESE